MGYNPFSVRRKWVKRLWAHPAVQERLARQREVVAGIKKTHPWVFDR